MIKTMKKQNNNLLIMKASDFLELFVVLASSEFKIKYVKYKDLMDFIAMCKSYSKYQRLISSINLLDDNYSVEMVEAISSLKKKRLIEFIGEFISILDIDFKTQLTTMKNNIEFLDLMRDFINDSQNHRNIANEAQEKTSSVEIIQCQAAIGRLLFKHRIENQGSGRK